MVRSWVQRVCALLRLVAPAAHGSEHPLAAAIVQAATERGLTMAAAEGFAAVTGTGMTTRVDGRQVLVGNGALLSEQPGWGLVQRTRPPERGPYAAPPPSARVLIPRLKEAGIAVAMMTGDNRRTAEAVAHDLGIERVFAEVRPELMCCAVT